MIPELLPDQLVRAVADALDSLKATDIVALDLRSLSDATDYFVIASGTSQTHVKALANRVLERLSDGNLHAHHVEGLSTGRWVLLDFIDVVVHVFHPTLREFYQLERLWADAPRVLTDSRG